MYTEIYDGLRIAKEFCKDRLITYIIQDFRLISQDVIVGLKIAYN